MMESYGPSVSCFLIGVVRVCVYRRDRKTRYFKSNVKNGIKIEIVVGKEDKVELNPLFRI